MKNESLYIKLLFLGIFLCLAGPTWEHAEELMAKRRLENLYFDHPTLQNMDQTYRDLYVNSALLAKFHRSRKGLWCSALGAAIVAGSLFGLLRVQKARIGKMETLLMMDTNRRIQTDSLGSIRETDERRPWPEVMNAELTDSENKMLFQMESAGRHESLIYAISFGFPCVLIIVFSLIHEYWPGVAAGVFTYAGLRLWHVLKQDAMTPHIRSAIQKIRKHNGRTVQPSPPSSETTD